MDLNPKGTQTPKEVVKFMYHHIDRFPILNYNTKMNTV